jgi:hypothetical protein
VIFAMFFLLKTMALPEFRVYHKNSKEPSWKVYRQSSGFTKGDVLYEKDKENSSSKRGPVFPYLEPGIWTGTVRSGKYDDPEINECGALWRRY